MRLCSICANINLEDAKFYVLQTSAPMKTFAEEGCHGCEFFIESAETQLRWDRKKLAASGYKVRLCRLGTDDNRVDLKFYTGPVDGDGAHVRGTAHLRLCSTYGFEPKFTADYDEPDKHFPARLIAKNSRDPECLDLAAAWLERCSRSHDTCCYPQEDVMLPTRLIRIPRNSNQKLQLWTTEGLKGRYVTLSYSWGTGNNFQTTQATFKDKQEGFEIEQLPKTLRDAIYLARNLGFEYIWIDALCIVQECTEDWARESSRMAEVYGNSSLTICADLSSGVEEGIFKPRNITRSHNFGPFGKFTLQTRGLGWPTMAAVYAGRVHNPLSLRGWAFQERGLSPRLLHFLDEQMAWECRTTVYMEEFRCHQDVPPHHFTLREWSQNLRLVRAKKQLTLESQMSAWQLPVQEIAVRRFTNLSDKLPSLSGLASAIEIPALGKYLAGIWENRAFECMVWFPRFSQPISSPYRAPSWSWASTQNQLMFNYPSCWNFDFRHQDEPAETAVQTKDDWNIWATQFRPQLLAYTLILKSADPKGEVLDGSHILSSGYCRNIYVKDNPNTTFSPWDVSGFDFQGRKLCLDFRENCESTSYFAEELADLDPGIDKRQLKKFLCFLIARERKIDHPKTLGLVLTKVYGMEKNTYRRMGLLAFDQPRQTTSGELSWEKESRWNLRIIKLI